MKIRKILAASAVALTALIGLGMPQPVQAASEATAVSTSKELKDALNDASIGEIIFMDDIIADEAMPINGKRNEKELIIDGNGYQFTERYVKTAKTTNGIYLTDSKTTMETITVRNLDIIGQSKYGTIYSTQAVRQNFENVTYEGPHMVDNTSGSARFENADIRITSSQGISMGEVAEAKSVYFAGNVNIVRDNGSTSDILALKKSGGEVVIEEGAEVMIDNQHDDGEKGSAKASAFISSTYKYDFIVKENASFRYDGTFTFEKSCKMNDFIQEPSSSFELNIHGSSGKYMTKAYYGKADIAENAAYTVNIGGVADSRVLYGKNGVRIGEGAEVAINVGGKLATTSHLIESLSGAVVIEEDAKVDIEVAGESKSYIFYSKNDMTIGQNAQVHVNVGGKSAKDTFHVLGNLNVEEDADVDVTIGSDISGMVMHITKNINVGERAEVKIDISGEAQTKAVKSVCAGLKLEEDSVFSIYSDGKVKYSLLHLCKDLIVENNATLDLVALNNTNTTTCEEVLYLCGGTLAFRNPDRVLIYNDSKDLKKSKPVYLGCAITMDIDVCSTRYWTDAATSGGHMVLENPDYEWAQSENYQMKAVTGTGKFKSFSVENYKDAGAAPTSSEYFFCSKAHRAYLWQGNGSAEAEEVTLTYDMNDPYPAADGRVADAPQTEVFAKGEQVTVAAYMFTDVEWDFIEWNTAADGSGMTYDPEDVLSLEEDTTLYARWKSLVPEAGRVYAGADEVTGTGMADALIEVELPDGNIASAYVLASGKWYAVVPQESRPLERGQVLKVRQTEKNKIVSDETEVTVVSGLKAEEEL